MIILLVSYDIPYRLLCLFDLLKLNQNHVVNYFQVLLQFIVADPEAQF